MLSHPEPEDRDPHPEQKPQTFPCNEKFRAALRELRAAGEESNNSISKQLGMSTTTISQYLNDAGCIYPGDVAKLEKGVANMLDGLKRRVRSNISAVECSVSLEIERGIDYIRRTGDVGIITAESGEGKTKALELIEKQMPLAIVFRARMWNRDLGSVESGIFKAIGSAGWERNTKRATFIVEKLRGSNRMLIVDDAHKLTRTAIQYLYDLHDETGCPIALLGTPHLEELVEADTQRASRTGLRWPVDSNSADLAAIMVDKLLPLVGAEREQIIAVSEQVIAEAGHARSLEKQLKLSVELKGKKGIDTWVKAFHAAHTQLIRKYKLN